MKHALAALDGCGHYAEFDTYWQHIFRKNVESFGTAPPRELQEFHSRLLQARDSFFPGVRFTEPDRPAQLPPPASDFVGRKDEMNKLESMLARSQISEMAVPLVIALTGAAGVGKTELSLHWAHAIKRQFPDGQLYADLSGYSRIQPADPAAVIGDLLTALGTSPAIVPETLAARTALLRTVLNDKRVLIVLDDAKDSDQVRPLLPASAHCALLVTSRHRLTDLVTRNGAHRLVIQPLTTPASITLLRRLLTETDIGIDKDSIDTLSALAGGIPQAIRTIAELTPLSEAPELAHLLSVGEDEFHTIHATLSWSYSSLPADAARLFRLLSPHPGPDFSLQLAAVLADTTEAHTRQNLIALINISLIESSEGRFSLHPLIRAFASRLLKTTDPEEHQAAASGRLLAWYLETTTAAAAALTSTTSVFLTSQDAIEWINTERHNLVAVVEYAAQQQYPEGWQLLRALRPYIERETPPSDWVQVHSAVRAAARLSDDLQGEVATLISLGLVHRRMGHTQPELECLQEALEICRSAQDVRGQAESLLQLAEYHERGDALSTAIELSTAALAVHASIDEPRLRADTHYQLAITHLRLDNTDEATRNLNLAAKIYRDRNDRTGQLRTLTQLGLLSPAKAAIDLFQEAVALGATDGLDPTHALPALVNLSELCCDDNQHEIGYTYARKAVGLCHPQHDFHHMVRALITLVRALKAIGRHDDAITEARKIMELVADVPHPASATALQQLHQLGLITQ